MSEPADTIRPAPPDDEEEEDRFLGQVLGGRYRVDTRLGEGGMGAVYRGEHLDLEREVAIKILAPELSRKRVNVERFQREAKTASRIGHPNIIDVFDMGRTAEGTPYLVMELLGGHDLEEELEQHDRVLSPARVVELLRPIANALDTCHAHGVIHRDIKPSNIFLAKLGDGSLSPKLVDFGLAMLLASDERLTRTGFLAGTPHYLPPEAAHGDLPGEAGDRYALATIAFEALCGELPYDAENPNGVLVQKVTLEVPAMADVSSGEFPQVVEAVLRRGLDPDPERRHASAAALIDDLEQAIRESGEGWGPDRDAPPKVRSTFGSLQRPRGAPVSSVQVAEASSPQGSAALETEPEVEPASLPVRRGPLLALLAGAALIALVLGGGAMWATVSDGETPREVPEAQAQPTPAPEPEPDPEPDPEPVTAVDPAPDPDPDPPPAPDPDPTPDPDPDPAPVRTSERPATADQPATPAEAPAPDRVEAERLVRSAGSLLVRGELASAIQVLGRARAADPGYPATYRSLGLAYERSRQPAQARRAYERYLRLAPGASDAATIRRRIADL